MKTNEITKTIKVARGETAPDLLISGGDLVNVFSAEINRDIWVGVAGRRIAYVGPAGGIKPGPETKVIEAKGALIMPGLIDAHTHLDSIFRLDQYVPYALASGNTVAVTEMATIANAVGYHGVTCFLEEAAAQPMRIFTLAPPLIPPFPEYETSAGLDFDQFENIISKDNVLGVGESYWPRVVDLDERALIRYAAAFDRGKTREGHAAGARGNKFMAYCAAGTTSCHEATNLDEVLERLRAGLAVMIREGFVRRELPGVAGLAQTKVDLTNVMLVTDLADPEDLLSAGSMNELVRRAIGHGFDPIQAVQMASINPARYYGLRDLGGVGPGKLADIIVVESFDTMRCQQVVLDGKVVAENGKMIIPCPRYQYPAEARRTVKLKPVTPEVFQLPSDETEVTVRAVGYAGETITKEVTATLKTSRGVIEPDPAQDVIRMAVFNRRLEDARPSLGFAAGLGLKAGAAAISLTWDTNNILAVGVSESDLALAVNRLIELDGGVLVVKDGAVMAELPLPIFGLISELTMPEIVGQYRKVEKAWHDLGSTIPRPFLTLQTYCFTGLPFIRLTDQGLVDIRRRRFVPLQVK
ncbi:MAG: adenine deaminase [Deltaproteobacteria bacterium]|nr:adenine deaminase [Deltaproteobacteria bacterium]